MSSIGRLWKAWIVGGLALMSAGVLAFPDIDESVYFPSVVQGHGENTSGSALQSCRDRENTPSITVHDRAHIVGLISDKLNFCQVTDWSHNHNCGAGGSSKSCEASGKKTRALELNNTFQESVQSGYSSCYSGTDTINSSEINNLTLTDRCKVTFQGQSEYKVRSLTMHSHSEATFTEGDYWLGSLTMTGHANIEAEGNVRIFISGTANLYNNANIRNTGSSGSITVVAYSGMTMTEHSKLEGNVYAANSLTMWGNAHIKGNVNARALTLGNVSKIQGKSEAVPASPLLLMHLDQKESGLFQDSSGNGFYGTPENSVVTQSNNPEPAWPVDSDAMGTCSYAIFSRRAGQSIRINDDDRLDLENNLTLSSWVYPTSLPGSGGLHTILSKDTNYEYHLKPDGNVYWWWKNSSGKSRSLVSQSTIPENQWSHIVVRYQNGNAKLYINGVLDNEHTWSGEQLKVNSNPLYIGQDQGYYERSFDGYIDEVQVFDSALTAQQVSELYYQRHLCRSETDLTCFSDDFSASELSSNWVTSSSSGDFMPSIVDGRLRFTEAVQEQSTSTTYQRLFPMSDNRVEISFDLFAHDGTGADGIALVLSDSEVTPRPGAFGGPLGYGAKPGIDGFAGGWLGIGFDEFGNYSSQGSPNIPNDGYSHGVPQSIALRGAGSGEDDYRYLTGTSLSKDYYKIDRNGDSSHPNNDGTPLHHYKVVIDSTRAGHSDVSVARKIGSNDWRTIIESVNVLKPEHQQPDAPENGYLSVTGSTGSVTNIHEIDNFKICALKSLPVGQQIDHFRFVHDGSGVNCSAEQVTLRACADANCSETFTDNVTVTLSPASDVSWSGDGVSGNKVTFSGGETTLYLSKTTEGRINLDTIGSTPSTKPLSQTLCDSNGDSSFNTSECNIDFTEVGLTVSVPDIIANSSDNSGYVQLVSQCREQSVDEGDYPVQFWSSYITPDSDSVIGTPVISIKGENQSSYTEISTSELSPSTPTLHFDPSGKAVFSLKYPDAGKLQLNAKYVTTVGGSWRQVEMEGSDQFVSFPKMLEITATKDGSGTNSSCNSASPNCTVFTKAGEGFELNVTASGEGGVVTPNYAQDGLTLTHTLTAPATGDAGELSIGSYNHEAIAGGTNTVTETVSEVGVFNFTVTPPEAYLGSKAYTIASASTGNVGRFTPAYLSVLGNNPDISNACGNFSYLGQPFGFSTLPKLLVRGMSGSGLETKNYQIDGWWKYASDWDGRSYTATPSSVTLSRANSGALSEVTSTTPRELRLSGETLSYTKAATASEPLDDVITLRLTADDVTDSDGICYQQSADGSCTGFDFSPTASHNHRWGRLVMDDTYGPETNPLRGMLRTEYYKSGAFIVNTEDLCTSVGLGDLTFEVDDVVQSYDAIGVGSSTTVASIGLQPSGHSGEGYLTYTAPGAGNQGTIDVTADLSGMPWMISFDSNNDGEVDASDTAGIDAIVQFGTYRGSDRIIWWTEPLE